MTAPTLHAPEHRSPFCACDCPDCQLRGDHVIHAEPGAPTVVAPVRMEPAPHDWRQAVYDKRRRFDVPVDVPIRSERDPLTPELLDELAPPTESEDRMLWGDR